MFDQPPTFHELMVWAETGVPPEHQDQGAATPNNSIVGETLNRETFETPAPGSVQTPRNRMNRTWFQGAIAAGVICALEVIVSLTWADGIDWQFLAFALVQAFVTGLVAYWHKTNDEHQDQGADDGA
ncbi:hypothetical protein AB0I72_26705 [Nocardiopsis sp. NPDC049922]|uniref:hypothetical protein n=1 Tax=Nocardiopsis sp. NPDC049922 TaxID=3155157 RepID=UPI003410D04E